MAYPTTPSPPLTKNERVKEDYLITLDEQAFGYKKDMHPRGCISEDVGWPPQKQKTKLYCISEAHVF